MAADTALNELLEIMEKLRSPEGCPWDQAQTHETLKRHMLEECYEAIDTIDKGDMEALCDELGDVLLQVVFHAQLAQEDGDFTMEDVIHGISHKMIHRHPHVFADQKNIDTPDDVMNIWEVLKSQEGKRDKPKELMDVPRILPALLRAQKLQEKASRVGFDWPTVDGAWEKLAEEIREVKEAKSEGERKEEIGDALFALVNVARFLQINPEEALDQANEKFRRRFCHIDDARKKAGRQWQELSLQEMDVWWEEAKKQGK